MGKSRNEKEIKKKLPSGTNWKIVGDTGETKKLILKVVTWLLSSNILGVRVWKEQIHQIVWNNK